MIPLLAFILMFGRYIVAAVVGWFAYDWVEGWWGFQLLFAIAAAYAALWLATFASTAVLIAAMAGSRR